MANDRLKVVLSHLRYSQETITIEPSGSTKSNDVCDFNFTLDNPGLTEEQRKSYEENGFIVIKNLVPKEAIARWRERFLDLVEGRAECHMMTKMKDVSLKNEKGVSGERVVNKIQDFVWDEVLSEYFLLPQILDYVECFTGSNIMAVHTMLINKPPDSGLKTSRHPMHQDLHYFPFRPSNRIVCAWTAMEKVDGENGCLFAVPGSHRMTLQQHDYPEWENGVNKMYHGVRGFDHLPKVQLEMGEGDTVFFHPLLFHGSGENMTKGFRKAISCHYAASECHFIDVRGTSQENIAKEVEAISRRRGAQGLDFNDIWKFRSRLVRGKEVNM